MTFGEPEEFTEGITEVCNNTTTENCVYVESLCNPSTVRQLFISHVDDMTDLILSLGLVQMKYTIMLTLSIGY